MEKIREYFIKYHTDKFENYIQIYEELLDGRQDDPVTLLEIGIGTLNPTESNMIFWTTKHNGYQPGASLRAFRDFFPNGMIYGVDIQPDCMIKEERIQTYLFSSTNKSTADYCFNDIDFDIIIDDGDHHSDSQIKTFENFFPKLKTGGVYILEDLAFPQDIRDYFEKTNYDYTFKSGTDGQGLLVLIRK